MSTPLSDCCKRKAIVCGPSPDFIGDDPKTMKIGTCFYRCTRCGEPCDLAPDDKAFDVPPRDKMIRRAKVVK